MMRSYVMLLIWNILTFCLVELSCSTKGSFMMVFVILIVLTMTGGE